MLQKKRDATAPELRGDLLDHALRDVLTLDTPAEEASPNRLLHRDGNRIFWNGFHHDLSRWWSGGGAASLSVCDWTGFAFGGETSALCTDLDAGDAWVEDRRPAAEAAYDFYFRFDFSQAQIPGEQTFFEGRTSTGLPVLRLRVRPAAVSGSYEIGAFAYDNGGAEVGTWGTANWTEGFVKGSFRAGTSGTFQVLLDFLPTAPQHVYELEVGESSNRLISEVRLGGVSVHPAASGVQRFRQFRSWRDRQEDLGTPSFDP